jgi:uncharacterized membrane protein
MITVVLYSRKECHLCEQVKEDLKELSAKYPHQQVEIDVDQDPNLRKAFGEKVPVVKVGPYQLDAPFTYQELQVTLGAARQRVDQIEALDQAILTEGYSSVLKWTSADRFSLWLSKHYMALLNALVIFYLALPFLAPIFMKVGVTGPAMGIYRVYGMACHQLAFRSWFLFGEQAVYPRTSATVPNQASFQEATGINELDMVEARNFVGNERLGYKVALCERDVAIYGAIAAFGLLFVLSGLRIPGLPWYLWVLIGMAPIGIDGVSQLLSQPPLSLFPYRESTPFLRTLTGGLFGFTTAWFGFPLIAETMKESRDVMEDKLARIRRLKR